MKQFLFILSLIFCAYSLSAQVNYVLNPSLEKYDSCPYQWDQVNNATYWSAIDSSANLNYGKPDYCNICADTNGYTGVPVNYSFYHYPRIGNGMMQVQMFFDSSYQENNQRDYLQGRLTKPLTANKSYCVTFYVSLERASEYAINNIGAYLDNGAIDTAIHTSGLTQTQYTPQVYETGIINDTLNWVKVEGSFIATGTEKFITIGNFFDKAHTSYTPSISGSTNYNYSWYLVDDISVIESDTKAFAFNTDTLHKGYLDSFLLGRDEIIPGIKWWRDGVLIDTLNAGIWCKDSDVGNYHTYILEQTLCGVSTWDTVVVSVEAVSTKETSPVLSKGEVKVWPNPVRESLTLSLDLSPALSKGEGVLAEVKIFNIVGQVMYSGETSPGLLRQAQNDRGEVTVTIDTRSFSKGVYFLQVNYADGSKEVRKVVKE